LLSQARVRNHVTLFELAGVPADRADQELSAAVCVLLKQSRERWAAVARDRLGVAGQRETHRLLGQPHRHCLASLGRRAADQEGHSHPLGILEPCGQIDQHPFEP
jgi:hypothetical protein